MKDKDYATLGIEAGNSAKITISECGISRFIQYLSSIPREL
jgi:hypothetical protein